MRDASEISNQMRLSVITIISAHFANVRLRLFSSTRTRFQPPSSDYQFQLFCSRSFMVQSRPALLSLLYNFICLSRSPRPLRNQQFLRRKRLQEQTRFLDTRRRKLAEIWKERRHTIAYDNGSNEIAPSRGIKSWASSSSSRPEDWNLLFGWGRRRLLSALQGHSSRNKSRSMCGWL